jgi:3-hydroxybutyryl-CoA dehydrogenase
MSEHLVGVAGGTAMGAALAALCLRHGVSAIVAEPDDRLRGAYEARLARLSRPLAKAARSPEATGLGETGRLTVTDSMAALADCDLVIDAAADSLKSKLASLRVLAQACPPTTVLCPATAGLSITRLAAGLLPERVVGLHLLAPVASSHMVEVVRGLHSGDEAVSKAIDLVRAWGRTPIVVRNRPGYLVARVGHGFAAEALRLLDENSASVEVIDELITMIGFPAGPFSLLDQVGLDTDLAARRLHFEASGGEARYQPSFRQIEMVDGGLLGQKSGKGFHDYAAR